MSITKRILGATALVTVAQGIVRLFGIGSAPILTSLMGPVPYGTMALINSIITLVATVALFGIETSYSRSYFGSEYADKSAVEQFCWRFAFGSSVSVALFACFFIWLIGAKLFGDGKNMLLVVCLIIILYVIQAMALVRARLQGNYRRLAIAIIASGALVTCTNILLAIYWRRDVWTFLVGSAIGLLALVAMLGIPDIRVLFKKSRLDFKIRRQILSLGLPAVFTAGMYWMLTSADRWFIMAFGDERIVGIYTFVGAISSIGLMLNNAFTVTWLPEAFRAHEENSVTASAILGRLWARLVASLLLVWLGVAALGGDMVRLLAASSFHEGVGYMPWIAGGVFFYGVSTLANTGMMLAKDIRPAALWWVLAGILNITINFIIVPILGALGAAISYCLSFAFVAVMLMQVSQRKFALHIPWQPLVLTFVSLIGVGSIMSISWNSSPIISMLLKLPVGIIVSAVTLFFIAPDWFSRLSSRLKWKTYR